MYVHANSDVIIVGGMMAAADPRRFSDFRRPQCLSSHENDQKRDRFQGRHYWRRGLAIVPSTKTGATDPVLFSNQSAIARLA